MLRRADPKRRPPYFLSSGALPAGFPALARSATTTTARTATTTASAEAAATAAALRFRPSLIDIERTAIKISTIESRNCAIRFSGVRHFDERKTTRTTGFAVGYQVDTVHLSIRLEERTDRRFSSSEIQIAYKDVFHNVVCLSIVALDSADSDVGQVVAGLSKGSFSIAGHCTAPSRWPGLGRGEKSDSETSHIGLKM